MSDNDEQMRQAGHEHQWVETLENIVSSDVSVIGATWSKCECGARLSVKDDQERVWEPMTVVSYDSGERLVGGATFYTDSTATTDNTTP
jgi:hypothetical protein